MCIIVYRYRFVERHMRPDIPVALRVTQLVLRLLVVLNGVYGAVVLAILVGLFVAAPWTLTALGFGPAADAAARASVTPIGPS